MTTGAPNPMQAMLRAMWMTGDFGAFTPYTRASDQALFERAHIQPGQDVLDVACGAGDFALRAAAAGARATGIDIAANLIAAARDRAKAHELPVRFDEGDVESMPYDDGQFDVVYSQFGVIFSARPNVAVAEMARVLKPGGRVILVCWTPDSWVGRLMQTVGRFAPPPPNAPSPLAWGDETTARARLSPPFADLKTERGAYRMQFPFDPGQALDFFLRHMGPVAMVYAVMPEGPRKQELRAALEQFFAATNEGRPERWETSSDYLWLDGRKP